MKTIVYKKDDEDASNCSFPSSSHSHTINQSTNNYNKPPFTTFSPNPNINMSDYKPTGTTPSTPFTLLPQSLTIIQSTTVFARTASLTSASAPASSPTARSTLTRPVSRVARPLAMEAVVSELLAAMAATTSPLSTMVSARMESLMDVSRVTNYLASVIPSVMISQLIRIVNIRILRSSLSRDCSALIDLRL